jgi:cytochrome c
VAAGAAGLVWDEANFVEYVQGPTDFLKAKLAGAAASKMSFKVKDAASAADVYAYLAQFSPAK